MRTSFFVASLALLALSAPISLPTATNAASKQTAAKATSWDGTWSGKWGGKSSGKITIKNNQVTSYYFNGRPQTYGSTKISGKTLSFGSGFSVTMTLTGQNSAHAVWKGDGRAEAEMSR